MKIFLMACAFAIVALYISIKIGTFWAGAGFSYRRRRAAIVIIGFFACAHFRHAYTGSIIFTSVVDDSPLRLVSFVLAFTHVYCIPINPGEKKIGTKKEIVHSRPPSVNRYEELFFHVLTLVIMTIVCATGFAAMVAGLLVMIFSIDPDYINYISGTLFISFVIFFIVLMHRTHKKHGRIL